MKISIDKIQKLQKNQFNLNKAISTINISNIFNQYNELNKFTLFMTFFNSIPNTISEISINCKKASHWFVDTYQNDINDIYYNKIHFFDSKKNEYDDIYCFVYKDLLIHFNTQQSTVHFLFNKTDIVKVEAIIEALQKFKNKRSRRLPEMSILVQTPHGIGIERVDITKPKLKIADNYNEDFKEIHKTIIERLSKRNAKGLVLLHGEPGTGKTSYIRYLIASVKKNVIFLPPNMASALTNPELVPILLENKNSIFVIEDAEDIVINRENNKNSPVSALLNISDGLLSDFLNIQLVCTFNTDVSKIDTALIRKGRLIAKYDFKKLEAKKANALSKKLGFDSTFISPMSLTDIYNQSEKSFHEKKERKVIGF